MPELAKPVLGPITSRYGWRIVNGVSNFHNGLDYGWLYANVEGSRKVYSAHPGVVADVAYSAIAGNYILVDIGGGYQIRYIHLASTAVRAGQRVGYSTYLGVMGDTGSSTSQIHLHMDLFYGANRVDPEPHVTLPFGYTGPDYSGGGSTPIEIDDEEQDMKIIHDKETGGYWLVGTIDYLELTSAVAVDLYPTFGQAIVLSNRQRVQTLAVVDTMRANRKRDFGSDVSGGFTDADRARLQAVPTAAQNGAAARSAIVK